MRTLALLGCLACLIAAGAPVPRKAPQASSSKPAAKPRAPSAAKKSSSQAKKRVGASKKTIPRKSSKARSKKRLPSWRTSQQAPTRERYQQIQQALIERGFLEGPATGDWDAASVAALKKFQASQNLEPTGKLDSLSLIALGLGPKRETDGAKPPPVPPPPPEETKPP